MIHCMCLVLGERNIQIFKNTQPFYSPKCSSAKTLQSKSPSQRSWPCSLLLCRMVLSLAPSLAHILMLVFVGVCWLIEQKLAFSSKYVKLSSKIALMENYSISSHDSKKDFIVLAWVVLCYWWKTKVGIKFITNHDLPLQKLHS